ncbi:MAG: TetR/AcrR family transcriptional regulator [Pseudomonadota bacterium]
MTENSHVSSDRRARRTEQAIFIAFRDLVLSRPYDEIRVADIVERADIGRSTFYAHYRNKDEVLTQSITWLFEVLADAAVGRPDKERLKLVVAHFHEQRHIARAFFCDRPLRLLTDRLAHLIEARERQPLYARALAAAQLEILRSWICGWLVVSQEQVLDAITTPFTD